MKNQKGRVVLLITVLIASVALLAWSVFSTWRQPASDSSTKTTAAMSEASEKLPPPLDMGAAKAKLSYPAMKSRGPEPGGNLESKALVKVSRREK